MILFTQSLHLEFVILEFVIVTRVTQVSRVATHPPLTPPSAPHSIES